MITIFLTENCNLRCSYCFEGKSKTKDEINVDKVLIFLKENIPISRRNQSRICFTGGEPFLKFKEMKFLVQELYSIGFKKFYISTNLTALREEFIDFLFSYKIDLQVSIDGDKESHDTNRKYKNGKSSFLNLLRNIERIKNRDNNFLQSCSIVVSTNTVRDLFKNVLFLYDLGFTKINCTYTAWEYWKSDFINIFSNQIELIKEFYIEEIERKSQFDFSLFSNSINSFLHPIEYGFASISSQDIGILPNGDIVSNSLILASKNWKRFIVGDLENGLNQKKMDKYCEIERDIPYGCTQCSFNLRCRSRLLISNSGSRILDSPYIETGCAISKIVTKVSDDIIEHFAKTMKENEFLTLIKELGQ